MESPGPWKSGEPVAGTMVYAASEEKGDKLEKVIEHTLSVEPVVSVHGSGWLVTGRMTHGKVHVGSDEKGEPIVEQRVVLTRDLRPTVRGSTARPGPEREPVSFDAQTVVTSRAGTLDTQDLALLDELFVTFARREDAADFVVEYGVTAEGAEPTRGKVMVEVTGTPY